MANYEVHIRNGILAVNLSGQRETVEIGFITSGQPVALKRGPNGSAIPGLEAEHYVTMVDGQPERVQTKEEFMDELSRALGAGGVTWQRP